LNMKRYLGNDYPLYYNNYTEIIELLNDDKILQAHIHLKNLNKNKFENEYLFNNIINVMKENKLIYN